MVIKMLHNRRCLSLQQVGINLLFPALLVYKTSVSEEKSREIKLSIYQIYYQEKSD